MADLKISNTLSDKIKNQVEIFANYNEENIKFEPEQCRKNLETIIEAVKLIIQLP
jgi:hypothetical protein